jgi:hypothetical protein
LLQIGKYSNPPVRLASNAPQKVLRPGALLTGFAPLLVLSPLGAM